MGGFGTSTTHACFALLEPTLADYNDFFFQTFCTKNSKLRFGENKSHVATKRCRSCHDSYS